MLAMSKTSNIIDEVEAYCRAANIAPTTLTLRAIGNARFFERFARRRESEEQKIQAIREYMRNNPAPKKETGTA